MTHFALQSYKKTVLYVLLYIAFAVVLAGMLYGSSSVCFASLLAISLVFSVVFAALTIPLWMFVQFVESQLRREFQQYINIVALCIVFQTILLAITSASAYGILDVVQWHIFVLYMPILLCIGILGFCFVYQSYRFVKVSNDSSTIIDNSSVSIESEQEPQAEIVERISVKHGQKIHVIPVETIQYLQAEGDYVMIYTNDSKYLKEQTMKYFESHLSNDIFVRIHRSYIVNVHVISNVQLYEKQQYIITLRSGLVIKASAAGYKLLKQRLQL
ncbi:MAG: Sensory transduction protein LytR [Bacteroidetes bacterium ADurb.Bin217]|nr:MAG: Sensory transduction protein LytR [Bacteroidetes bacterium ADurb.Bin217]